MDDSSDPTISFDQNGVCSYCTAAFNNIGKVYFPNEEGQRKLDALLSDVKKDGKGNPYADRWNAHMPLFDSFLTEGRKVLRSISC